MRHTFGGTNADGVFSTYALGSRQLLELTRTVLRFYDAETGGNQYMDLLDKDGNAVSSIVTDLGHVPAFQGPDEVTEMWADDGDSQRHLMVAQGRQGPVGPEGPQGAPGGSDAAFAGWVEDEQSQTRAALSATYDRVIGVAPGDDLAAVLAAAAAGDKIVVRPGTHPVTTLTLAVKAELIIKHGATITQAAATTGDLLTITGAGATVRGRGILDGNKANQAAPPARNRGVTLDAPDVTVRDVTVQNTTGTGVYNNGHSGVTIRNVRVIEPEYIGIFSEADTAAYDNLRVIDNHVDRSAQTAATIVEGGLKVRGTSALSLTNCQVSGNTVAMPSSPTDSTAICIEVQHAPASRIQGNGTEGGSMGLSVVQCDRPTVSGNVTSDAETYGIEVPGCPRASIVGNTVTGVTTGRGILLADAGGIYSTGATVTGNTIGDCSTAIKTQGCAKVSISGNTLAGGTGVMIDLAASDYSTISGNTFDGLGTATKGVMVNTTSQVSITGNTIHNTTQHGVLLYAATAYAIAGVGVHSNTMVAVGTPLGSQLSGGATLGTRNSARGNIWSFSGYTALDWIDFGLDVREGTGSGAPEGTLGAGVGSTYTDLAATRGASVWRKASGTGTTGWKVVKGDTGWRHVVTAGAVTNMPNLAVAVRRVNDTVQFATIETAGGTASGLVSLWTIPTGFQAQAPNIGGAVSFLASFVCDSGATPLASSIYTLGGATLSLRAVSGARHYGTLVLTTSDPWPTTLPGTAA